MCASQFKSQIAPSRMARNRRCDTGSQNPRSEGERAGNNRIKARRSLRPGPPILFPRDPHPFPHDMRTEAFIYVTHVYDHLAPCVIRCLGAAIQFLPRQVGPAI